MSGLVTYLESLVHELGATFAVILESDAEQQKRVLVTVPDGMMASGLRWSGSAELNPGLRTSKQTRSLLPVLFSLKLEKSPQVIHIGDLCDGEKKILVGWCANVPDADPTLFLGRHQQVLEALIQESAESLRLRRSVVQLRAAVESLDQGVVITDGVGGSGYANSAAAHIMGIRPGEVPPEALARGMRNLRQRAVNASEINQVTSRLLADPKARIDAMVWQYPSEPTHLRVSTHPGSGVIPARIWVFDDVSGEMQLLEMANSEAMYRERFRRAMVDSSIGMALINDRGEILECNHALTQMLDLSAVEIQKSKWQRYFLPVDDMEIGPAIAALGGSPTNTSLRYSHVFERVNDNRVFLDLTVIAVPATETTASYLFIQAVDVTAAALASLALHRSELEFRLLAENSGEVVGRVSEAGKFEWISAAITKLTGWQTTDLIGRDPLDFIHPDDLASSREYVDRLATQERVRHTARFRRADGSYIWLDRILTRVIDDQGVASGRVVSMRDVDEQVRASQELMRRATHDDLTGLANRDAVLSELATAQRMTRSPSDEIGIIFVDFDKFKYINDTYGHAVGDEFIVGIATRLRENLRATDIAARIGGDEMLIVLREVASLSEATMVAQDYHSKVTGGIQTSIGNLECMLSFGVTLLRVEEAPEDAINRADEAMYVGKTAGGNQIVVRE